MLSAAKHLSAYRDRPFAALRVTRCDCSGVTVQTVKYFLQIEPCLIYAIDDYSQMFLPIIPIGISAFVSMC